MRDAKSTLLRDEFSYLDLKAIIPEAIHSQMMKYFRQYIAIGGMPEAVQKYIDTRDFRIISGNPRQFNYRDESANCAYLHS